MSWIYSLDVAPIASTGVCLGPDGLLCCKYIVARLTFLCEEGADLDVIKGVVQQGGCAGYAHPHDVVGSCQHVLVLTFRYL